MKKFIIIVYVVILITLGMATFLENTHGVLWAHAHIYGTGWFSTLWVLLVLLGIAYFIKIRERRVLILLLHGSFVLILLGALVSHLTGRTGSIHLRLYHGQDLVEITHNGQNYIHRLPYQVVLENFEVVADENGSPLDYRSEFTINGRQGAVSMNKIHRYGNIRFYQMSYDEDMGGVSLAINRDPYGIPITYCGYALLFGSFIYLCLRRKMRLSAKLWLVVGTITLLWCVYYFVLDGSWSEIPVLRSPLLFIHVITIIIAYALLLVMAVRSAVFLSTNHKGMEERVPSSSVTLLNLALCFLAIGIFLGAIWANISWGNYWSWDSKEVWALITFMVYAVPAHRKSFPAFQKAKVYHWYILGAFSTVLMTYLGVNYCLTGMHSYV